MLCFKNDGIFSHYPIKHFIGESFANGHVPLWNPFINWGYPQYADLTGAWWNPITWLFGYFTHYPIWAFHAEQVLYVFIAAAGMYRLLLCLKLSPKVALMGAICYISIGYLGEHYLFKEWVCGAAFLPWCLLCQQQSLTSPSIKNNTQWAAALFLFVASAHPSQSVALLYASFFIMVFGWMKCRANKTLIGAFVKKQFLYLSLTTITFIILALGMAFSIYEVILYLLRGEGLSATINQLPVGTTLQSWVTMLTPLAGIKNNEWFGNWQLDSYMARNCFIGTIAVAALLPIKGYKLQSIEKKIWLLFLIFFCITSVTPIRLFCFKYVPLFGFTQMNGVYRLFPMLFLIVLACYRLDFIFSTRENNNRLIRNLKLLAGVYIAVFIAGLIAVIMHGSPGISMVLAHGISATVLKTVLYTFSNGELWLLQGVAGFIFSAALVVAVKKTVSKWLFFVLIAEGAFYTNIFLPFSSLQSRSQQQVQQVIMQQQRKEWALPLHNQQSPAAEILKQEFRHPNIFLHQSFQDSIEESAMAFKSVLELLPAHQKWVAQPDNALFYPAEKVVFKNDTASSIDFLKDSCCNNGDSSYIQNWQAQPGSVSFEIMAPQNGYCLVMQSYYPGWKATINGKEAMVLIMNKHFIAVSVQKGENQVQIVFDAGWKPYWVIISFSLLAIILGAGMYSKK